MIKAELGSDDPGPPPVNPPPMDVDQDVIFLDDSDDSIIYLEATVQTSSSLVDRGNVSWKECIVSHNEMINDGLSFYYQDETLLNPDIPAEPDMKTSLLAGSEKLNRFLKQNGTPIISIYDETDIHLEELLKDVSSKLSERGDSDVNLNDIFNYKCQISTDRKPRYNSRCFDDTSFNYSNSGIVWPTDGSSIVPEKASLTSLKKMLSKSDRHTMEPLLGSARKSESLKIRIPKVLMRESKTSSPPAQVSTCSSNEPVEATGTETPLPPIPQCHLSQVAFSKKEARNASSSDDCRNLATESRKKKIIVDGDASTSKSTTSKKENDEPVERKKMRSSDNISVKSITKHKSSTQLSASPITSLTFLDILNSPSSSKAMAGKSTIEAKKPTSDPMVQSHVSFHGKSSHRRSTDAPSGKIMKRGLSGKNTTQHSTTATSSTSANNREDDLLGSIFSNIDKNDTQENIQNKTVKSSVWTHVNCETLRQSSDPPREQDSLTENSVVSTEASTASALCTGLTVSRVAESILADRSSAAASYPYSSQSRPSSSSDRANNVDEFCNTKVAPAEQMEMEPDDVAFNVFASSPSPLNKDGPVCAIPGFTPPRQKDDSTKMEEMNGSRNGISPVSASSPEKRHYVAQDGIYAMSRVESVLSEISLDLTDQFGSPSAVNKTTDDLTEDPADDDVEDRSCNLAAPTRLVVNAEAFLVGETADNLFDDPADDNPVSESGPSYARDYLMDDPADELDESTSQRSANDAPVVVTKLDESTSHSPAVDNVFAAMDDLEEPDSSILPGGPDASKVTVDAFEDVGSDVLSEPSPCCSSEAVQRPIPLFVDSQTDKSAATDILEDPCASPTLADDDLDEPGSYVLPVTANMVTTSSDVLGDNNPVVPEELEEPSPCGSPAFEVGPSGIADLEGPSPYASPNGSVRGIIQGNIADILDDPADELAPGIVRSGENDEKLNTDVSSFTNNLMPLNIKREVIDEDYGASGTSSTLGSRLQVKQEIVDNGYGEYRIGSYLLARGGALYTHMDMEDPADEALDIEKYGNSPAIDDLALYRERMDAVMHLDEDPADDEPYVYTVSDDDDDSDIEIIDVVKKKNNANELPKEKPSVASGDVRDMPPLVNLQIKTNTDVEKPLLLSKLSDDRSLMKMITSILPTNDRKSLLADDVPKAMIDVTIQRVKSSVCLPPKKPIMSESEEFEYLKKKLKELFKTMGGKPLSTNEYSDTKIITVLDQQKANREAKRERDGYLSHAERRLQEHLTSKPIGSLNTIPVYRGQFVCRLNYPFDKCDGLWWPVTQPSDAININSQKECESADVINQMYNHSCYSHERQSMLLCDPDSGRWRKDYKTADALGDTGMAEHGRFKNRIGFKRVSRIEDDEIGRENDRKNQEQEQKWLESLPNDMVYEVQDREELRRMRRDEKGVRGNDMKSHVEFNLVDEYTSERFGGDRFYEHSALDDWISPPEKFYVSANDRRDYLCVYTNWANRFIHEYMESLNFPNSARSVGVVRSSLQAAFCYQTQTSSFLCHPDSKDYTLIQQRSMKIIALADEIKKQKQVNLRDCVELFKLQKYEYAYWPIIWDGLVSFFKKYPFVSQMSPMLHEVINRTFRLSARVAYRENYFIIYSKKKRAHVEEMRERERRRR